MARVPESRIACFRTRSAFSRLRCALLWSPLLSTLAVQSALQGVDDERHLPSHGSTRDTVGGGRQAADGRAVAFMGHALVQQRSAVQQRRAQASGQYSDAGTAAASPLTKLSAPAPAPPPSAKTAAVAPAVPTVSLAGLEALKDLEEPPLPPVFETFQAAMAAATAPLAFAAPAGVEAMGLPVDDALTAATLPIRPLNAQVVRKDPTNGEKLPSPGKLHFLFMAYNGLPNKEVWTRFLGAAVQGRDYEVLVHCKEESQCRQSLANDKHIFRTIPTVESEWCENLVAPMDALLATALDIPGSSERPEGVANDKFVFLSHSSVPTKSFNEVRHRLTVEDNASSNFCITPQKEWAWHSKGAKPRDVALKHHQWVTLSRADAMKVVQKRADNRDLMRWLTPLHWLGTTWMAPMLQDTTSFFTRGALRVPWAKGCIDEYLYFAQVFGQVEHTGHPLELNGLSGSPILTSGPAAEDFQGRCDTFLIFGRGAVFSEVAKAFKADADTSVYSDNPEMHPALLTQLSPKSLEALRSSPFLFARKVDKSTLFSGNATLAEAFQKYIFDVGAVDNVVTTSATQL